MVRRWDTEKGEEKKLLSCKGKQQAPIRTKRVHTTTDKRKKGQTHQEKNRRRSASLYPLRCTWRRKNQNKFIGSLLRRREKKKRVWGRERESVEE